MIYQYTGDPNDYNMFHTFVENVIKSIPEEEIKGELYKDIKTTMQMSLNFLKDTGILLANFAIEQESMLKHIITGWYGDHFYVPAATLTGVDFDDFVDIGVYVHGNTYMMCADSLDRMQFSRERVGQGFERFLQDYKEILEEAKLVLVR